MKDKTKFYIWFAAVLAFAFAFSYATSDFLVELTSERFVYGGDACPQDGDLTCGMHPAGLFLSSIVGGTIAVVASYPIVRSTL